VTDAAAAAGETPDDQSVVDAFVRLLDLRMLDVDRFEGMSPPAGPQRVFGGQVAGQALVAAGRTVDPTRRVHSLHAYFVRPGDPSQPIIYSVDRIRDGRSFSVRRSVAFQYEKPIFFMSASFQRAEQGLEHQMPMPDVPPPDALPSMEERLAAYPARAKALGLRGKRPFDVRYVSDPPWASSDPVPIHEQRAWIRITGVLPDDPLLHACALTFCSDITLLEATVGRHGEAWGPGGMVGASLDHALWLHRPFRADEWFLYDCMSPSATGARGLATGNMFTMDGRHIATAVQEGLLRRVGG
jgi:acyl-CoA thioesterase-2